MTAEVRDLALWVERWGGSVSRPDVVAARDDMVRRFLSASLHPPADDPAGRTRFPHVELGEPPLSSEDDPRGR